MKALAIGGSKQEPSLVIADLPEPSPQEGEALIRVACAGLMPTELSWFPTWFRKSGERRCNAVPSHEFSGTVESLGPNAAGVAPGDEIFGINDWFSDGAMAEYCVAPIKNLVQKPRTLTHAEASSVPISALTAWQALFEHGHLQAGQRVLIQGAAGGVGSFALQLAKRHGAVVIGTASGPNLDFVRQLGADQVIDYVAQPFESQTGKFDLVVDTVGGETLQRSWSVLAPNGRLVTVASAAENATDERTRQAFFLVEAQKDQLTRIASLLNEGVLRTFVKSIISLSEAAREYVAPARGAGYGKTVVKI